MPLQSVIDEARSWIGTKESDPNFVSDVLDWVEGAVDAFGEDYPWCAALLSQWMYEGGERDLTAEEAGADKQFPNGFTSTDWMADLFEDKGLLFDAPEVGDLAFYDFESTPQNQKAEFNVSHVGLVVGVNLDEGTFTTIEANTADNNGEGEDGVYERIRTMEEAVTFARPSYEPSPEPPKPPYQSFLAQLPTGQGQHTTNADSWVYLAADYDGDAEKTIDLIGVKMNGTESGKTEVHVLDGASGYKTFSVHAATDLHATDADAWNFSTADYNGDSKADLIGIKLNGTESGQTEVHVLDGASGYNEFLAHTATALHATDAKTWDFSTAYYDGNGTVDLVGLKKNGTGSDQTELHVLDGGLGTPQSGPRPWPSKPDPNALLAELEPTGASAATASQDGLEGGVDASHAMAQTDAADVFRFVERFEAAAEEFDVPPALLAGIASRESRGGVALDENGLGDGGNGHGIMQVDENYHEIADIGPDFGSQAHIDQATGILADYFAQAKEEHPEWEEAVALQAATAAYNTGTESAFASGPGAFDDTTTGEDYSNDVIARAQYYAETWDMLVA